MRMLVFGGTGMLGRALAAEGRRRNQPVLALSRAQGDVRDRRRLAYWAGAFAPEVIVNCAAFTQVDACEERRQHALEVNGEAVAHVAAAAAGAGAALVQVSSDYVFDGGGSRPYREDDPLGPLSVYGESKRLGEERALAYERALVVRASWLFGAGGPSFPATIRRLIADGKTPLRVVDDQVGAPTYTPYLARAIWDLAQRRATGVVHYRNRPPVSWYGVACEIAAAVRPRAEVVPVTTSEFPRPAPRPAYSVLDVGRFEELVGRAVEPWLAGLTDFLDTMARREGNSGD
ncbi:MAG: dTDP-4-dehydrorhamnose reductase [Acidobacteria bacterium]|nr:MAG: dTDP-4-dehydrorhamnose reductase [Acidobacteriota bacterium]